MIDYTALAVHAEKMDGQVALDMQTALLKAAFGDRATVPVYLCAGRKQQHRVSPIKVEGWPG